MSIFTYYVYVFGTSFHLWTFLMLFVQGLMVAYNTRKHNHDALVIAVTSVSISIHAYETFHGFLSWAQVGHVDAALWKLNIPVALASIAILYFYNKKYDFINLKDINILISFILTMLCFIYMTETRYFITLNQDIVWGLSKLFTSTTLVSFFKLPKKGAWYEST